MQMLGIMSMMLAWIGMAEIDLTLCTSETWFACASVSSGMEIARSTMLTRHKVAQIYCFSTVRTFPRLWASTGVAVEAIGAVTAMLAWATAAVVGVVLTIVPHVMIHTATYVSVSCKMML